MKYYGSIAAKHYAAYRPPLHAAVVQEALGSRCFQTALDVGCGTGHSSIALLANCKSVVAIDNCAAMIFRALDDPRIDYRVGDATDMPLVANQIDLVSVAGVLPYIDVFSFASELRRVCRKFASILVYDFQVETNELYQYLRLPVPRDVGTYVHSTNLSNVAGLKTVKVCTRQVSFSAEPDQVTHLFLADESRFGLFSDHFGTSNPAEVMSKLFRAGTSRFELKAKIWITLHQLAA